MTDGDRGKDWEQRIGGDPWRNLLWEETRVINGLYDANITTQMSGIPDWIIESPENIKPQQQVFSLALPINTNNPEGRAYLIYQTGRLFCIGAPKGISEQLGELLPTHIVLLSWSNEHTSGLNELLTKYKKTKPAIWTSAWLWSEMLSTSSDDYYPEERLFGEDDIERELQDRQCIQETVITFEHELNIKFTPGVSVYIEYTNAIVPGLRVTFRCNGLELTIDPLNKILTDEATNNLCKKLETQTRVEPGLKQLCTFRMAKIRQRKTHEHDVFPSSDGEFETIEPFGCLKSNVAWRLSEVVATDMIGQLPSVVKFSACEEYHPVGEIKSNGDENHDSPLNSVGVAILCGQLGHQKDQLDPARLLSLPEGRVVSILQWHLESLLNNPACLDEGSNTRVFLMTSPGTDFLVRQELARLRQGHGDIVGDSENGDEDSAVFWLSSNSNVRLQVRVSEQTLVPRVKIINGKLEPAKFGDGGWDLRARGHLDVLRTLIHWRRKCNSSVIPNNWLVLPFNNLGKLYNEETWTHLNTVASSEKITVSAETFDFQVDNASEEMNPDDSRWRFMSVLSKPDNSSYHLLKADYLSNKSDTWPPTIGKWSSHTWYFHLPKLVQYLDNVSWKYIFAKETRAGGGQGYDNLVIDLRQDIDQVTFQENIDFKPIDSPESEENNAGLYQHNRFLVVRREDDLRNTRFYDRFEKVHSLAESNSSRQGVPPVFEVLPATLHYIWGGKRLRREMELGMGPTIAEVWFGSTHSNGPSLIPKNHRELVPLRTFIDGDRPFIFKYLDCHDKLSIQVHPNNSVAQHLAEKKTHSFSLQDKKGKEEAFYVLHAPKRDFHLFMGFEKSALADLAAKLRPVMESYATDDKAGVDKTAKDIVVKISEYVVGVFVEEVFANELYAETDSMDVFYWRNLLKEDVKKKLSSSTENGGSALKEIIEFHIGGDGESGRSIDKLQVLGKEYLLAAVGFVAFLERLRDFIRDCENSQLQRYATNNLFNYKLNKNESENEQSKRPLSKHPLLKYFHTEKIETGKWGRVPPGVVHSWQGDGNFLIEIGQASDNTFRIFDFGRELSDLTAREMHYHEALYALTEDAVFGKRSAKRYIVYPVSNTGSRSRIHSEIDCKMLGGEGRKDGVPGEFALKPRWVADKVPYSGFANGSYPTQLVI